MRSAYVADCSADGYADVADVSGYGCYDGGLRRYAGNSGLLRAELLIKNKPANRGAVTI